MKYMSKLEQTPFRNRTHAVWFRLCAVCLSMYTGYVVYLAHSRLFMSPPATAMSLLCYVASCVGIYALLDLGCSRIGAPAPQKRREHLDWRVFALAFVITLGVLGASLLKSWPGCVNYDVSNQWHQVHSGEYNNWHPLFHTLLMGLLTRIYDSYPFAVLVQIAAFAALFSYLTATLHRSGVPKWLALAVHTFVTLSLPVRNTLMYFGKDSAMTLGVLALSIQAVRILDTNGQWLKKPLHLLALGLAVAYTTLLRVNALFFTLPFLACIFFAWRPARLRVASAAVVAAVAVAVVQGPVFGSLDVIYPSNTLEESIGVPMTILCDIRKEAPQHLDTDTRLFLNGLAGSSTWQDVYVPHNYNSIKFTFPRELIAEKSAAEILGMTARAVQSAPRTAFESFNGLTDLVWDITGKGEGYQQLGNSGGIAEAQYSGSVRNTLGMVLCRLWEMPMGWGVFAWLTENIGVQMALLLMVTLWALYRRGPKVLVFALPTLLYNLGTMLLLAGNDARFFHFSMTVSLPYMLALIFLSGTKEENKCS